MSPLLLSAELLMISQRRRFETVTERTASTSSRARKRGAAGADGVNCGEPKLMPNCCRVPTSRVRWQLVTGYSGGNKKSPEDSVSGAREAYIGGASIPEDGILRAYHIAVQQSTQQTADWNL